MKPESLLSHGVFLRGLARSLLRDEHHAEDVVQRTWQAALEKPPREEGSLRAWLARCTRNFAVEMRRKDARRERRERRSQPASELAPSAAEVAEREQARRLVVEALLRLDEPYRSVILLRFYEGLPPRTIASRLGVPVETVRTRMRRGLERLREQLDRESGGDRRSWCQAIAPLAAPEAAKVAFGVLTGAVVMKFLLPPLALGVLVAGLYLTLSSADPDATRSAPIAGREEPAAGVPASLAADTRAGPGEVERLGIEAAPGGGGVRFPVTGEVRAGDGGALGDARIELIPIRSDRPRDENARWPPTRSLGDGTFRLEVVSPEPVLALLAQADGFAPATIEGVRPGGHVTIRLDRPRRLSGRVVDSRGVPIAAATVSWSGQLGEVWLERSALADDQGRFLVEGLPSVIDDELGGELGLGYLEVRAEGFAPLLLEPPESALDPRGDLACELVMMRGMALVGQVVLVSNGQPVAGARVSFNALEGDRLVTPANGVPRPNPLFRRRLAQVVSDAEGRFRLDALPCDGFHTFSGAYVGDNGFLAGELCVVAPGLGVKVVGVPLRMDGEEVELEVELEPAGGVTGRVVDRSGRPVARAMVSALVPLKGRWSRGIDQHDDPGERLVRTDDLGRYRLAGIPARVEPWPIRAQRGSGLTTAEVSVRIEAGQVVAAPDLILEADRAVLLRVEDTSGAPIAGAVVEELARAQTALRTDRTGVLMFPVAGHAAEPGGESAQLDLVVRAAGFASAWTQVGSGATGEETRVVTLSPGQRIEGRVLFEDGSPVPGAELELLAGGVPLEAAFAWQKRLEELRRSRPPFAALPSHGQTLSRPDGRFTLRDVGEGPYRLVFRATADPGDGSAAPVSAVLEGVRGGASELILRLPAGPPVHPAGGLEGMVVDRSSGDPLLEFDARLSRGDLERNAEPLGPGRFRFERLVAGEYRLVVSANGYLPGVVDPVRVDVQGPPGAIEVRLERGATILGTVRGLAGVREAWLRFQDEEGGIAGRALLGSDGHYRISGFPPGTYTPEVGFYFRSRGERTFVLPDDRSVTVTDASGDVTFDFAVQAAMTLEIQVHCERLRPATWLELEPTPEQLETSRRTRLRIESDSGAPILERSNVAHESGAWIDLPAGRYRIVLEMNGLEVESRDFEVDLEDRGNSRVVFRVE